MPINLQIIRTSDFVRMNSNGEFDFQATRNMLSSIAKTCVERGIDCALIDLRHASTSMTAADLYQLALTFREMGFHKHHRLAVLHRYREGERAEFFSMLALDQGWKVRAFDEYEEAMDWFGVALPPE